MISKEDLLGKWEKLTIELFGFEFKDNTEADAKIYTKAIDENNDWKRGWDRMDLFYNPRNNWVMIYAGDDETPERDWTTLYAGQVSNNLVLEVILELVTPKSVIPVPAFKDQGELKLLFDSIDNANWIPIARSDELAQMQSYTVTWKKDDGSDQGEIVGCASVLSREQLIAKLNERNPGFTFF